MSRARFGELSTISEIAKHIRRPYRQTLRLLVGMARRDASEGERGKWLIDNGPGKRKLVNLQSLRASHPALFERRYVSREEYEDVVESLRALRDDLHKMRQQVRALQRRKG